MLAAFPRNCVFKTKTMEGGGKGMVWPLLVNTFTTKSLYTGLPELIENLMAFDTAYVS